MASGEPHAASASASATAVKSAVVSEPHCLDQTTGVTPPDVGDGPGTTFEDIHGNRVSYPNPVDLVPSPGAGLPSPDPISRCKDHRLLLGPTMTRLGCPRSGRTRAWPCLARSANFVLIKKASGEESRGFDANGTVSDTLHCPLWPSCNDPAVSGTSLALG